MTEMLVDNEIAYVCKLLNDNLQLPVRLFGDEFGETAAFVTGQSGPRHPLDPDDRTMRSRVFADDSPRGFPCFGSWNGFDQFVWLRFGEAAEQTGAIVIGPAACGTVTDEMIDGFLFDHGLSGVYRDPLRDYYRQLTVRSRKSMLHAGTLLYYAVSRQQLYITEVIDRSGPFRQPPAMDDEVDRNLADRRLRLNFHHHPNTEKMILQCVTEGRTADIARTFDLIPRENLGVLSRRSRLRNEKNMAICLVTLATRAAIDGGLYPETAYTASDLWIQHIEELKDADEVINAGQEILLDFADRVSASAYPVIRSPSSSARTIFSTASTNRSR